MTFIAREFTLLLYVELEAQLRTIETTNRAGLQSGTAVIDLKTTPELVALRPNHREVTGEKRYMTPHCSGAKTGQGKQISNN